MARVPNHIDPVDPICEVGPDAVLSKLESAATVAKAIVVAPVVAVAKALVSNVSGRTEEVKAIPKATRYMVEKPSLISSGGMRTPLPAGKILSSAQYDIDQLKRQGVILSRLPDDTE